MGFDTRLKSHSSASVNSLVLISIGLFSSILGFIREIQIASLFGVSMQADMFYLGTLFPEIVSGIIASFSANIYMLHYGFTFQKKEFMTSIIVVLGLIMGSILILLEFIAPQLIGIIASGYSGEELQQLILMIRIMLGSIMTTVCLFVFNSTLNMNGRFIISGTSGLIYNLGLILATHYMVIQWNVMGLAWAYLAANLIRVIVVFPFVKNSLICSINIKSTLNAMKELHKIIATNIILYMQVIIERSLASTLNAGAISAINYASRINGLPNILFTNSILTVMSPRFIKESIEDKKRLAQTVILTLKIIVFPISACGIFFFIYREDITSLFFHKGKFTETDTIVVATLFMFYAPHAFLSAINQTLIKLAYAIGKVNLNIMVMIVSLPFYILSSYILKGIMGVNGLVLSLVIYNLIMLITLIIGIRRGANGCKVNIKITQWYSLIIVTFACIGLFHFIRFPTNLLNLVIEWMLFVLVFVILTFLFDKDLRKFGINFFSKYFNVYKKKYIRLQREEKV